MNRLRLSSPTIVVTKVKVFSEGGCRRVYCEWLSLVICLVTCVPTPELSFAVRHLDAHCGIVLTASHNPPQYNGYKVYGKDGGQLVPPEDKAVIGEIEETTYEQIQFKGNDYVCYTLR